MARSYAYKVEAYKNGGRLCTLQCTGIPTITCNASASIKTSLALTIKHDPRFNPLRDEIRVFQIINGVESPAGVYVVGTSNDIYTDEAHRVQMECYDRAHLLQLTKTESILHLSAGSLYIETIKQLLATAGIAIYAATPSSLTLTSDREDWDVGTDYLTIINDLLAEINYNSVWFDLDGTAMLTPKQTPTVGLIRHRINGLLPGSILRPDLSRSLDIFDAPNVFRVVCNNPDLAEPLVATAENDSALSPASIINRGRRILSVSYVDNVADLATLQAIAQRKAYEHMSSTETVTAQTANLAGVRPGDVVALQSKEINGLYQVEGYTMSLTTGQNMRLTLRRSVLA